MRGLCDLAFSLYQPAPHTPDVRPSHAPAPLRTTWIWDSFSTPVIAENPRRPSVSVVAGECDAVEDVHMNSPDPQRALSMLLFLDCCEQALSPGRGEERPPS